MLIAALSDGRDLSPRLYAARARRRPRPQTLTEQGDRGCPFRGFDDTGRMSELGTAKR